MEPLRAIGVFDSGIGGLSVLRALCAELPGEHFAYVADTAHAPYGERTTLHIRERARAVVRHFSAQQVKAVVIACNTATAAAIHELRVEFSDLAIIGVEPAIKPAAAASRTGIVGVMATRSTLSSPRFESLLDLHKGTTRFVLQPCDGLADAIEGVARGGDEGKLHDLCARHLQAMGEFGPLAGQIDTLVLGCTHYPLAERQIAALAGAGVEIMSTGEAVARQVRRVVESSGAAAPQAPHENARISLSSTGCTQSLQAAAAHWLGHSGAVNTVTA